MTEPVVSPGQVRAARAWLKWSQSDLAQKSGVSLRSIAQYELERSVPYEETLLRIRVAFEQAGMDFQFNGMLAVGISIAPR